MNLPPDLFRYIAHFLQYGDFIQFWYSNRSINLAVKDLLYDKRMGLPNYEILAITNGDLSFLETLHSKNKLQIVERNNLFKEVLEVDDLQKIDDMDFKVLEKMLMGLQNLGLMEKKAITIDFNSLIGKLSLPTYQWFKDKGVYLRRSYLSDLALIKSIEMYPLTEYQIEEFLYSDRIVLIEYILKNRLCNIETLPNLLPSRAKFFRKFVPVPDHKIAYQHTIYDKNLQELQWILENTNLILDPEFRDTILSTRDKEMIELLTKYGYENLKI